MATKKTAPTNEELLAQFEDLGVDESNSTPTSKPTKPTPSPAKQQPPQSEQDLLAELDNLASQKPASRPSTPRLASTTAPAATRSPKRTSTATPPPGRGSEEKSTARKSGESARSFHTSLTPATTEESAAPEKEAAPQPTQQSGGGWWGGLFATASAAVKQAEAAVKEIQKNEEAQRWAEQAKGSVGALRGLGGELRTLALPTFTSIIHTLAPPISSHERLQIHITHDLSGYPSLDPIIYAVFSRVMAQVEGGDLLVVQRGQEASPRRASESENHGTSQGRSQRGGGWNDGPWWRSNSSPRSISVVSGAVEASKLARASAEAYATDYFASRGGVEEAAKQATEVLSESNPVRSSDIFLAIQAISQTPSKELFMAGPTAKSGNSEEAVVEAEETPDGEVEFAIYLHDPIHGIAFHTVSQAVPQKWVDWLDAPAPPPSGEGRDDDDDGRRLPESIQEIIESGGVDPREWVSEWVEEVLTLGVGVVAQRYVARRMGVGEGGVGRGKMRAEKAATVESGGGEAARAGAV